jgi:hypothetical protein
MIKTEEDKNSICSDEDQTAESIIIKDKNEDDDEEEDDDDDEEENGEEEEEEDDDDDDDDDEEDEEDEEDDGDDNNEFDKTIIQFEMMKNFFIDKEGENISTHLGSISHELRKLNKIAVKLLEKKN